MSYVVHVTTKIGHFMNFDFSLTHDSFVVETQWFGDLTGDIIVDGIVKHNNWIIENSDKLPLVLFWIFILIIG